MRCSIAAGAVIAALMAASASAQTAQPATSTPTGSEIQPDQTAQDGDIVVTAQKRSEKLRDVPASVSVISGETIERTGAKSLADYASYIPGFAINSGGAPGRNQIVLRGINTGGSDTNGALVGIYLDDTPLGSSSANARGGTYSLDLLPYDIDRLEVLRGPQGTLYGASSMGGLVKYVLKQADPDALEVRAGGILESTASTSRPTWGLRGETNIPIVDGVLAVRASGYYQDNAGWIDNVGTRVRNENGARQQGGRVALFWRATDKLDFKATALLQDINADGTAAISLDRATLEPEFDKYSHTSFLGQPFKQRLRFYSLTGDWDVGFASLTSATSWSSSRNTQRLDATNVYTPLLGLPAGPVTTPFDLDIKLHKFTQELRLASPTGNKIEWLLGGFYTNERAVNVQNLTAQDSTGAQIPGLNPLAVVFFPSTYREYAVFGNLTYKFTDWFDLSGGVRYSHNKQSYFQDLTGLVFGTPQHTDARSSDNVTTWSTAARFHPDRTSTIYLRIATGYRPGGPNVPLPGVPTSFKADTLTNYEAGYKASLFDGKLDLDVSGFYIDWRNIQIEQTLGGVTFPGNGGKASSRGFEASGSYKVNRQLRLGANASYTVARLDQDVPSLNGLKGDQLPLSPRWTVAATIDYSSAVSRTLTLTAGAAFRYRGKELSSLTSDPTTLVVRAQNLVDGYVGLESKRVAARLYIRNAFNNRSYSNFGEQNDPAFPTFIPVQPRTIGVSLDTRF